jgi:hypothetical protein
MSQSNEEFSGVIDIWSNDEGTESRILLLFISGNTLDLVITRDGVMNLFGAINVAGHQLEAKRHQISPGSHPAAQPFLRVDEVSSPSLFGNDQIGLTLTFRSSNGAKLDFVLSLSQAQALRDQLDANIAAASQPPTATH